MSREWSGPALAAGQLSLMATNVLLSLSIGYAGGLAAVGAVAPGMLVFQLTCGMLQRALAEATLLAGASATDRAPLPVCRYAVGAALAGGSVGALLAGLAGLTVTDVPVTLAVAYAVGVPFAVALDVGRSASVAVGASRAALVEAALWFAAHAVTMLVFAALRSPLGVCVSWAVVNAAALLIAAGRPERRPGWRGLPGWVRARRDLLGPATLDAFLVGLTPLLAVQLTAVLVGAATLGAIRLLQQVFSPLAFVSITVRRVLVYRRRADEPGGPGSDLRDGLTALGLTAAGALVIGLGVLLGRRLVPALAFVPTGAALIAAGVEKAALGLSYGCALRRFVAGEFGVLLRTRYLMLLLTLTAAPALAVRFGATGYLLGSALALAAYSAVLLWPGGRASSLFRRRSTHRGFRPENPST